ncbi:MAG: SDR family oxidoreductase [Alphaproteobacteria bacterium]|nr:SDR family oxidoreductase [Alphaproteobacteria bacterium]MBN9577484.1 SDR family oxidoreductase [Alphaproteobacteria bacterium]MBN9592936.1 SDR family oxidoreductase [Alphaproteobacteria bacterium]
MVSQLFDISGKTALVTGGSRGIGLMIARGFVQNGAKVYISSRKAEACERAAAELSKYGTCIPLAHDLGSMAEVKALAEDIKAREKKLDILVNNAGAAWAEPFETFSEEGWDKLMNVNLKAIFFLSQALLPELKAAGTADDPARIVNIGSIDGILQPQLESYAYSASKAAVHHLTHHLAKHLARDRINVNAIAPGPFETKMLAPVLATARKAIESSVPRGRIGEDDDMIGAAIFFCSRASSFITGQVLAVDGGIMAAAYMQQPL